MSSFVEYSKKAGFLPRVFLSGVLALNACNLPTVGAYRNPGPGYLGTIQRIVPPDDGQPYSSSQIPSGWSIYERRSPDPMGHVDEKRGMYIEDGLLCVVGQSRLWRSQNDEAAATEDARRDASMKLRKRLGLNGEYLSGFHTEAAEQVVVKNSEGEVSFVVEVRCTIPLEHLPRAAKRKAAEKYGGI